MNIYLSGFFGLSHKHGMLDVLFSLSLIFCLSLLGFLIYRLFDFDSSKATARQNEGFDSLYKSIGKKLDEQDDERSDRKK